MCSSDLLADAVALVQSGGGVAAGISARSAEAVHAELVAAGGAAEIVGPTATDGGGLGSPGE